MGLFVRKYPFFLLCTVFVLDVALLFDRSGSNDSPIPDLVLFLGELELEESENSAEKEPSVQSTEFSIEISTSDFMSMIHHAVISVEESDQSGIQVSRGPPGKCAVDGRRLLLA